MTLQNTKEHLIQLLREGDNKAIALSGKWGTGKTHLWREVVASSEDDAVQRSLYVSLFGLSDINQVKLKAIQSALSQEKTQSKTWQAIRTRLDSVKNVLTSIHSGFSALDEIAILAAPLALKSRVVVLDDIERKHKDLNIDEILGFIDELTQQQDARFVLIMNSDKLEDSCAWETLREKVIDQEIRLITSTSEAYGIANSLAPSVYANQIRDATERCGLTNIRVIRRVIRCVNRILDGQTDLSTDLLARIVPSTVLLSAIHYKGIDNGPDVDFVLAHGTPDGWSGIKESQSPSSNENQQKSDWTMMLHGLGIYGCDDYERLVVEFLQSGLFDPSAVSSIISRYIAQNDVVAAQNQLRMFQERVAWDHRATESDLLVEASTIAERAHLLNVYDATLFCDLVDQLPGGESVSRTALDRWIAAFKKTTVQPDHYRDPFGRRVHPTIQAELDEIECNTISSVTVVEACEYMVRHSGWGVREELAMKSATTQDFEEAIRRLDVRRLQVFMRRMLEMTGHRDGYREHFGDATVRFADACRKIAVDPHSGRLGALIKGLFSGAGLGHLVEQ
jgi:hypothetical protein